MTNETATQKERTMDYQPQVLMTKPVEDAFKRILEFDPYLEPEYSWISPYERLKMRLHAEYQVISQNGQSEKLVDCWVAFIYTAYDVGGYWHFVDMIWESKEDAVAYAHDYPNKQAVYPVKVQFRPEQVIGRKQV
jgi:hypothetical protein